MQEVITLTLPTAIKTSLDARSQVESISTTELIERAISEYLLVRRFRSLREKMLAKADQQGGYTDDKIFE